MADETCSLCEKPAPRPVLACLDCVDGLDEDGDPDRTYYCSTRCQFADKKDHTKLCADTNIRKQIFRAGAVLMAALYQYRSVAYDMKIEKVVKSPYNELILFEGDYDDCNQGDDLLFEFPDHLVKDPFDAAAMLTYMACQDAFNFLYELSRDLLQGKIWIKMQKHSSF